MRSHGVSRPPQESQCRSREKPPPEKDDEDQPQRRKRPILLKQQFPVYPHGRPPILFTILSQPPAHLTHPLQAVPTVQQILNVLRHDLCHISQFVVELVQIGGGTGIGVGFLGALDEGVELDEGVRTACCGEVLG